MRYVYNKRPVDDDGPADGDGPRHIREVMRELLAVLGDKITTADKLPMIGAATSDDAESLL